MPPMVKYEYDAKPEMEVRAVVVVCRRERETRERRGVLSERLIFLTFFK